MLRNAFEALGTEFTLKRILRAVSYARTSTDQLRVNVDNSPTVAQIQNIQWATNGAYASWYANGSPMSMDPREMQATLAHANFQRARTGRWTFI